MSGYSRKSSGYCIKKCQKHERSRSDLSIATDQWFLWKIIMNRFSGNSRVDRET